MLNKILGLTACGRESCEEIRVFLTVSQGDLIEPHYTNDTPNFFSSKTSTHQPHPPTASGGHWGHAAPQKWLLCRPRLTGSVAFCPPCLTGVRQPVSVLPPPSLHQTAHPFSPEAHMAEPSPWTTLPGSLPAWTTAAAGLPRNIRRPS